MACSFDSAGAWRQAEAWKEAGIDMTESVAALTGLACMLVLILIVRQLPKPVWLLPMLLYIAAGAAFSAWQPADHWPVLKQSFVPLLQLLSEAGLVMMLFQAGLDANLADFRRQLPAAVVIWLSDVLVSAVAGFACATLLGFDFLTALFITVAFTATSVGVSVALWGQAGLLSSPQGSLLLEIAELDDISTILLLSLLLAFTVGGQGQPDLTAASSVSSVWHLLTLLGWMFGFIAVAYGFGRYLEPGLTQWIRRRQQLHDTLLWVVAVSLLFAVLAELAGLSLAIGAFLAGLAFSSDKAVQTEKKSARFLTELLSPFFFFGLGTLVDWPMLSEAGWPALWLLLAAIAGKFFGNYLPVRQRFGHSTALTIGVSMAPRSEVAMIVMQKGLSYGLDPKAFLAMLVVVLGSVMFSALSVPLLLKRLNRVPD